MEATAATFAWHLANAEIVASTSQQSSAKPRVEVQVPRSFAGPTVFPFDVAFSVVRTSSADVVPLIAGDPRPEDRALADLSTLRWLPQNWDGEGASRPNQEAVREAIAFIVLAGSLASRLDPTLHVDGSVLLEVPEGGALQFTGTGEVSYAILGKGRGHSSFNKSKLPEALKQILS